MNKLLLERGVKKRVLDQCIDFFQKSEGFHCLLLLIKRKYESLGKIGGSVKLTELKNEEKEAFTGFFGKDYLKSQEALLSRGSN